MRRLGLIFLLLLALPMGLYVAMDVFSRDALFSRAAQVPPRPLALVLGTSKYLRRGGENPFYRARIDAAAQLWRAGKVQGFVVSGAHPTPYYNEPRQMRRDLVALGVPKNKIILDDQGSRTLESIVRMGNYVGGYVVVSQHFHNVRAVFLARALGQCAVVALDAPDVPLHKSWWVHLREVGARLKALVDVWQHRDERQACARF